MKLKVNIVENYKTNLLFMFINWCHYLGRLHFNYAYPPKHHGDVGDNTILRKFVVNLIWMWTSGFLGNWKIFLAFIICFIEKKERRPWKSFENICKWDVALWMFYLLWRKWQQLISAAFSLIRLELFLEIFLFP